MESKILTPDRLARKLASLRRQGKKIVFTNGCFDLLHVGHVRYLRQARALGDILVVALNTDDSVRRLKGSARPVQSERDRAEILAALECVDYLTGFGEETPLEIIQLLVPDVLVKGGDWTPDKIVGKDVVEGTGGRVVSLPFVHGVSTSDIIQRIREESGED